MIKTRYLSVKLRHELHQNLFRLLYNSKIIKNLSCPSKILADGKELKFMRRVKNLIMLKTRRYKLIIVRNLELTFLGANFDLLTSESGTGCHLVSF